MEFKNFLQQIQSYAAIPPLIILGSGASKPYGLPLMGEIQDEILKHKYKFNAHEWLMFSNNLNTLSNLEESIDKTELSEISRNIIREIIWEYINNKDIDFFYKLIENKIDFPIVELLNKLIKPSGNKVVIVTTNYDRVAEYAADIIGATIITGFEGMLIKKLEFSSANIKKKREASREQIVEIWKVHGSLDWFKNSNDTVVSYPLSSAIRKNHIPLIIPPGKEKYNDTHGEPYRDIIAKADEAFENAKAYLCIGYGFNDEHIQPKLIKQIKNGKPIIVLSLKATDECKRNVINNEVKKSFILEQGQNGHTRIINNAYQKEYAGDFWNLSDYIKTIWGK